MQPFRDGAPFLLLMETRGFDNQDCPPGLRCTGYDRVYFDFCIGAMCTNSTVRDGWLLH